MVAAAVVAAGAGCGKGADGPSDAAQDNAPATLPGAAEKARAVRDSTELIGRYDAAAAAHPALAARLRPLRAEVARHVEAFGGKPPAAVPSPAAPAATAAQALAGLAAAERALADRRAATALTVPGELARLIASVAAAGAGHAALLGSAAGHPASEGKSAR
ncbi:hypothetical protein SAMN05216499_11341 [Actinacidiphila paucisporea]|uniref:Lipoprotein n=1 Tax=Actinacidiphila paucisporea TaxID=310782 RepID=A0A1M7KP51_9ACTN|nr:hypothetical protein SAMN05216499_11341 [Actinacidiphila paucisporea]